MKALSYEIVRSLSISDLADRVDARLPDKQPHGAPIIDHSNRLFLQSMVSIGGAVVTDGMDLEGVEPTGSYTDTVTFTVEDGVITGFALS